MKVKVEKDATEGVSWEARKLLSAPVCDRDVSLSQFRVEDSAY